MKCNTITEFFSNLDVRLSTLVHYLARNAKCTNMVVLKVDLNLPRGVAIHANFTAVPLLPPGPPPHSGYHKRVINSFMDETKSNFIAVTRILHSRCLIATGDTATMSMVLSTNRAHDFSMNITTSNIGVESDSDLESASNHGDHTTTNAGALGDGNGDDGEHSGHESEHDAEAQDEDIQLEGNTNGDAQDRDENRLQTQPQDQAPPETNDMDVTDLPAASVGGSVIETVTPPAAVSVGGPVIETVTPPAAVSVGGPVIDVVTPPAAVSVGGPVIDVVTPPPAVSVGGPVIDVVTPPPAVSVGGPEIDVIAADMPVAAPAVTSGTNARASDRPHHRASSGSDSIYWGPVRRSDMAQFWTGGVRSDPRQGS